MVQKTTRRVFAVLLAFGMIFMNVAPAFALGDLPVNPPADTTPPIISGVVMTTILPTGATLAWTTNELAVSTFQYGTTQSYGSASVLSASAAIGERRL